MQKQETADSYKKPEADRPIRQYRAGAIPKVRRRRAKGRQLALGTARRGGLAAWKKRGGGWGVEIGPGRQRLTLGRTASEGSGPESGRMVAGEGSESERTAAGAWCWGGSGSAPGGNWRGNRIPFLFYSFKL
jgi:hypothetical protein